MALAAKRALESSPGKPAADLGADDVAKLEYPLKKLKLT